MCCLLQKLNCNLPTLDNKNCKLPGLENETLMSKVDLKDYFSAFFSIM